VLDKEIVAMILKRNVQLSSIKKTASYVTSAKMELAKSAKRIHFLLTVIALAVVLRDIHSTAF
jgi:energy-converting hydrogenase A subunit M